MQIKNKTYDMLNARCNFQKFHENGGTYYGVAFDYFAISMSIVTDFADEGIARLKATVGWSNDFTSRVSEQFVYSEGGFKAACAWIDKERIKLLEQLL